MRNQHTDSDFIVLKGGNMDDFRGLYVASWSAPGYTYHWKAYIIAEDNVEAEYFWHMHLKQDEHDRDTWNRGKRNCCTHAEIRPGDVREAEDFAKCYPRKRKKGVYKCEPINTWCGTDHLWD